MRRVTILLLLIMPFIGYSQSDEDPVYDLSSVITDEGKEFNTEYIDRFISYIAHIDADGQTGQGLFIGKDIIITSLSLVANNYNVTYTSHFDATPQRVTEYIVADEANGLVLLKAPRPNDAYMVPELLGGTFPSYDLDMYFLYANTGSYKIEKAVLPSRKEERSSTPDFDVNSLSPVQYEGSRNLNGSVLFPEGMRPVGLIVHKNEKPFLANKWQIQSLVFHSDLDAKPLSRLAVSLAPLKTERSKPDLYEVALNFERKPVGFKSVYAQITLNYVQRQGNHLDFYFAYKPVFSTVPSLFNPDLQLIDLETGMIYRPVKRRLPNNLVYTNTSYLASFSFQNVPSSVNRVKFFDLPADLPKYFSNIRSGQVDFDRPFFTPFIINNYPQVKKPQYNLNENVSDEGTVAFYLLKNSNTGGTGQTRIYVNGKDVGVLDRYYNMDHEDYCGRSASITLRLKAGEYKYKAVSGNKMIERKFIVKKGECSNQHVKF